MSTQRYASAEPDGACVLGEGDGDRSVSVCARAFSFACSNCDTRANETRKEKDSLSRLHLDVPCPGRAVQSSTSSRTGVGSCFISLQGKLQHIHRSSCVCMIRAAHVRRKTRPDARLSTHTNVGPESRRSLAPLLSLLSRLYCSTYLYHHQARLVSRGCCTLAV